MSAFTSPLPPNNPYRRPTNLAAPAPTPVPPRSGKSPLPPHRLAAIANTLGIATPTPASYHSIASTSYVYPPASATLSERARRSPTPSTATFNSSRAVSPSPSKFLLHVVPPLHLPHDSGFSDTAFLTPPTPSSVVSSYSNDQFRRGALVPLLPTLQAQLQAIAKEYALPSTAGMVLYLITSTSSQDMEVGIVHEPGPRLSEDIWKLIWARAVAAENKVSEDNESISSLSRSPTGPTRPFALGSGLENASTSSFASNEPRTVKRSFGSTASRPELPHSRTYPITPTPSSPSSSLRYKPKSQSSKSISEPETPNTSLDETHDLPLPGIHSVASFIPILAKVEFDFDRRKATWYEPWSRSRRARLGNRAELDVSDGESMVIPKSPLMDLTLVQKLNAKPFANYGKEPLSSADDEEMETGYARLSESPDPAELDGDLAQLENDEDADTTARFARDDRNARGPLDPFEDVFGKDEDHWAAMQNASPGSRRLNSNPNVVNLSLNADELNEEDPASDYGDDEDDERDVRDLWDSSSRPRLSVSIPSGSSTPSRRKSSPLTAKRHIPPSLTIQHVGPSQIMVSDIDEPDFDAAVRSDRNTLAYLDGDSPPDDIPGIKAFAGLLPSGPTSKKSRRKTVIRPNLDDQPELSPALPPMPPMPPLPRPAVADLDDDVDPDLRRSAEYAMKERLDEIERDFRRFSPRTMEFEQNNDDDETPGPTAPIVPAQPRTVQPARTPPEGSEMWPPPPTPDWMNAQAARAATRTSPTRKKSRDLDTETVSRKSSMAESQRSRAPSHRSNASNAENEVPELSRSSSFSAKRARSGSTAAGAPGRLALTVPSNGSPPKPPALGRKPSSGSVPLAADTSSDSLYPPHLPSSHFAQKGGEPGSPVIPLSPDPFGRTPTEYEVSLKPLSTERKMTLFAETARMKASGPPVLLSSPPSMQSRLPHQRSRTMGPGESERPGVVRDIPPGEKSNLVSVRSIKKLWRKSGNKSVSNPVIPPTRLPDGRTHVPLPMRPLQPPGAVHAMPPFASAPTQPSAPTRQNSGRAMPVPARQDSVGNVLERQSSAGSSRPFPPSRQTSTGSVAPLPHRQDSAGSTRLPTSLQRTFSSSSTDPRISVASSSPPRPPRPSVGLSYNVSMPPPLPEGTVIHPNRQSSLKVANGVPYPALAGKPKHSRSSSGMDPFHFDQDSRYPVHRSSSSISSSPPESTASLPPPSKQLVPVPMPLPSELAPASPPMPSRRKSILKSWKSSGSISSHVGEPSVSGVEVLQPQSPRTRRRPSIPDMMRKSLGGIHPQEIPPSPEIPHHYAQLVATNRAVFPTSDAPIRRMSVSRNGPTAVPTLDGVLSSSPRSNGHSTLAGSEELFI